MGLHFDREYLALFNFTDVQLINSEQLHCFGFGELDGNNKTATTLHLISVNWFSLNVCPAQIKLFQ